MRIRTAAPVVAACAFLLWNAIFDHVLTAFGDLYVVLAPALWNGGLEAPAAGWLGPGKTLAFWCATGITLLLVAGCMAALRLWTWVSS